MKLVAIDFETADRSADSACAIGIVSIEKGKIVKKDID
jgi:DNA polymerase III epsilon subunit-like protein